MELTTHERLTRSLAFVLGMTMASCSGSAKDLGDTDGALRTKVDDTPADKPADEKVGDEPSPSTAETTCDPGEQRSFEEATTSVFSAEHLYGVWITEELSVDRVDLPSGSKRVTLTVAENHLTVVMGETADPRPLLDGNLGSAIGAREGFEYTLIPTEVLIDEYPDPVEGVYGEAYRLTVAPDEVYGRAIASKAS